MTQTNIAYACFVITILTSIFPCNAETNIAPDAVITSRPYIGATLSYLVDGKIDDAKENTLAMSAPLAPRLDGGVPLWLVFKFKHKVRISGIQIYQIKYRNGRVPAREYVFEGDGDGDGKYERLLIQEKNGNGGRWYAYRLHDPIYVYSVRFRTLAWAKIDEGPNYGVPAIAEIRFLSPDKQQIEENIDPVKSHAVIRYHPIESIQARLKKINEPHWRKQYPLGLFSTMWRFWNPEQEYDCIHVDAILETIHRLGANRLWLYPESTAHYGTRNITIPDNEFARYYSLRRMKKERQWAKRGLYRIYPIPSKVAIGYKDNILSKVTSAAHLHNLGVIINQRLLPYGIKGWDFPRVSRPDKYPCILSSRIIRQTSIRLIRELMKSGADGIALGGDEFFYHGHTGRDEEQSPYCHTAHAIRYSDCRPTCETLFKQQYGHDIPKHPEKPSKTAFDWQLFQYGRLANLFHALANEVRSHDGIVTSLFRPGEVKRMAYGVAYDIMGVDAGIEEMGSDPLWSNDNFNGHYYIANETVKLMAASPKHIAVVTLQTTPYFDKRDYRRPIMVYGSAISALMHGARGINYYKEEYLNGTEPAGATRWVARVFGLIHYLDHLGLSSYHPPKNIVLLYSRSSEDWWRMIYSDDPVRKGYPVLFQNAVMEVLFRSGIPFDMYYLDQPDTWHKLDTTDLIIVPFGYSISDRAWEKLIDLNKKGVDIWWMIEGPELDERGRKKQRKMPFRSDVFQIHLDKPYIPPYHILKQEILKQLTTWPGIHLPAICSYKGDVECGLLANGRDRLVFLLNWATRPAIVQLSVKLENGDYYCEMMDLDHVYTMMSANNGSCNAKTLNNAVFELGPGAVNIIWIKHQLASIPHRSRMAARDSSD